MGEIKIGDVRKFSKVHDGYPDLETPVKRFILLGLSRQALILMNRGPFDYPGTCPDWWE
jgi:hypothetical protein